MGSSHYPWAQSETFGLVAGNARLMQLRACRRALFKPPQRYRSAEWGDPAHWRVLVGDMLIFLGHVWAFGESIALCLLRRGIVGSSH